MGKTSETGEASKVNKVCQELYLDSVRQKWQWYIKYINISMYLHAYINIYTYIHTHIEVTYIGNDYGYI